MDDETFEINKKSVINNLLEKPKTIYEQKSKYWREIRSSRYQFEREENVAKQLENVKKEDILKFYREYIVNSSNTRTKFTTQCYGNQHELNVKQQYNGNTDDDQISCYNDDNVINWDIKDIKQIREECGYYPFPYTDTSKL